MIGFQDMLNTLIDHCQLYRVLGDLAGAAVPLTGLLSTGVIFMDQAVLRGFDRVAEHEGSTVRTVDQAREQELRIDNPGMLRGIPLRGVLADMVPAELLYLVPGLLVDQRLHITREGPAAITQFSQVDPVAEECWPAVDRSVQAGCPGDLSIRSACSSHLPGHFASVPRFRIRHPPVDLVSSTGSLDDHGLLFESPGRSARHGAILYDVIQAPDRFKPHSFDELDIHPVISGFKEPAVHAFREGVCNGMDDESTATEICFVELGIIQVAGKTGELPQYQAGFRRAELLAKIGDHFLEPFTPADRCPSPVNIAEDLGNNQVILLAPGTNGLFLLVYGEILLIPPGVAEVSRDQGSGGEGRIGNHFFLASNQ